MLEHEDWYQAIQMFSKWAAVLLPTCYSNTIIDTKK